MSADYILNCEELTSHGNVSLRRAAVDIIEHALAASDPYLAVKRWLHLEGSRLRIQDLVLDLNQFERIFILGAGKASAGIARALEEILGDRICDGLFVLKYGDRAALRHTRVIYANHPVPDENSLRGAQEMMALARTFTAGDLVFAGITGGSSALLSLPVEGVSLDDMRLVNQRLLLSGADIVTINTIRKHLSRIKGGRLAAEILPATLINLTVSDVVGDMLDYITCPTVPDTSTFDDARRAMDAYDLWDQFPPSACEYLRRGGPAQETPKAFPGQPLYSFVIVPGDAACLGAYQRAKELGFNTMLLTSMLTGEAKEAGAMLAAIAKEVVMFGRPLPTPCAVIAGGENTVTIGNNDRGVGGPNQELVLSAGQEIAGLTSVLIAAVDTDGIDGATEAAGAMMDGHSWAAAEAMALHPREALKRHDAHRVLAALGDAIVTGLSGTNVNDVRLLLVDR